MFKEDNRNVQYSQVKNYNKNKLPDDADFEEDDELDMEVDSSTDMVSRLFRLSITNGIICAPIGPVKVL
jgi:hypothetical protein